MAVAALKRKSAKKAAPKKQPAVLTPPPQAKLDTFLGSAAPLWPRMISAMKESCAPFEVVWKPATKIDFDRYCILQRKDRRLLYLVPKPGEIEAMVVLGERAFDLAMASPLSAAMKKIAREAKNYTEGRFIRFPLTSLNIPDVVRMVEFKLAPK